MSGSTGNPVNGSKSNNLEEYKDFSNPVIADLVKTIGSIDTFSEDGKKLSESMLKLCNTLNEYGKESEIGSEAVYICDAFDEYLKNANEYIALQGDKLDASTKIALRDSQIALNSYRSGFQKAFENINEKNTVSSVLNDTSWISKLFKKGVDTPPIEIPNSSKDEIKNRSLKENIDTYKQIITKAGENYDNFIKEISGDAEHPDKTIAYRTRLMGLICSKMPDDMLSLAIDKEVGDVVGLQQWTFSFDSKYTDKFEEKNFFPALFDDKMEKPGYSIDHWLEYMTSRIGNAEKLGLDINTLNRINDNLKLLSFKPKYSGLSTDSLKTLKDLNFFGHNILNLFEGIANKDGNGEKMKSPDSPYYGMYSSARRISEGINGYLLGMENAKLPDDNDLLAFADELSVFVSNPSNYTYTINLNRGTEDEPDWDVRIYKNEIVGAAAKLLEEMIDNFPYISEQLQAELNTAKQSIESHITEKYNNYDSLTGIEKLELNEIESNAATSSLLSDGLQISFDLYNAVFNDTGIADYTRSYEQHILGAAENFGKEFTIMGENTTEEQRRANWEIAEFTGNPQNMKQNLKHILVADYFEREIGFFINDEKNNRGQLLSKMPGNKMYGIINKSINGEDSPEATSLFKEHVEKFLSRPGIRTLLNSDAAKIKELFQLPAEERHKIVEEAAMGQDDLLRGISDETIDVFSRRMRNTTIPIGDKNFAVSNSAKYDRIAKSLNDIIAVRRDFEEPELDDYLEAFDACSDYLNNRSPEAYSPAGKNRFAAAAEIGLKLGLRLREKITDPEQKELIDTHIKNTIIRSSDFRKMLLKEDAAPELKEFAAAADLRFGNKNNTATLDSDAKIAAFAEKYKDIERDIRRDCIENGKKLLGKGIKDAMSIKDSEQQVKSICNRLGQFAYLESLSEKGMQLSVTELRNDLAKESIARGMKPFEDAAREFIEILPVTALSSMSKSKDFAKELTAGFKLFRDLKKDNLLRHPEEAKPQAVKDKKTAEINEKDQPIFNLT